MKVTAATVIETDTETIWQKSQNPVEHVRWDLRFTNIDYLPKERPEDPQRFRYATRIGLGLAVEGWGESVTNSQNTSSALKFGSEDRKSLIREGVGSWTYAAAGSGVRFSTIYDYSTRYGWIGGIIDRAGFRPLIQWATRWSFDRLRIWLEDGMKPEISLRVWIAKVSARVVLGLVWIHEGLIPKILSVEQREIALVARAGFAAPETTLLFLGIAEIGFGIWLLTGRGERLAVALSTMLIIALTLLVTTVEPSAWADPLGGIRKNLGLIACAAVVWLLSPVAPLARRGNMT